MKVLVGLAAKAQVVVEHQLVHLHHLPQTRVNCRDVLVQEVLGKPVLVVPALFMHIDFAQIYEEFLFVVFVKTVAHRDVLLIIVDPVSHPKIIVACLNLLQGVSRLLYLFCLFCQLLSPDKRHL